MPPKPSRRRTLRALAGSASVLLGGASAGCLAEATPKVGRDAITWPGFLGGPRRTGWHAGANGPDHSPEDAWTWTPEDLNAAAVRPAVADDTAYVAVTTVGSSHRLVVSARALADGTERWQTSVTVPALDSFPPASTAVTADVVVASTPSRLVVFDRDTGEERWRTTQGTPSPPVVDDAVVVLDDSRTDDRAIRCLDVESGAERWQTPWSDLDVAAGGSTPYASSDGARVFLRDGATVTAVSLETGEHQWTRHVGDEAYDSLDDVPPVRDGKLELVRPRFASGDEPHRRVKLVTLDAETGRVVRDTTVTDRARSWATSAAVGPETVVFAAGGGSDSDVSPVVVAVDRETGDVRWRTHLDAVTGTLRRGPLVDGDRIYLLSDRGRGVAALSLDDGTVQWRDDTTSKALFGLGGGGAFVWAADDEDAPGIRYVD